jgi:AcrR family transcriptional regulator
MPRSEREALILREARSCFAQHGFHETTMEEVATRAGVTKPIVYSYFGSKEGLLMRCAEEATGELLAALERSSSAGPRDRRLWHGLLTVFDWIDANREGWAVLYPDGPARAGPFAAGLVRTRAAVAGMLTRLLVDTAAGEGVAPAARAHIEPIAYALLAATEATAEWWLAHPEEPRELQALRLMNFAWSGLGGMVEGRLWTPPPGA